MRWYCAGLLIVAAALRAPSAVDAVEPPTARPNIVLIVADDLGYGDLGCYGSKVHKTPHIDRLAAGGLRFTDFHANGCVCSPTRAALMTGQYQQRSGIESAIGFVKDEGMPLAKTTLAEVLSQAGYACGLFGKWHLGHVGKFGPNDQGFHKSWSSNNTPDYHTHISRVGELDWFEDHEPSDEPGYLTHLVTKHTCQFIEQHHEQPFFLFVSHLAVHFPFQGPHDPPHRTAGNIWHDSKYGPLPQREYRRAYRDMLTAVDDGVGQIVAKLDELQLRDKTLIFLTSDNGAYAWVGSNGGLRGEKGDLFEGGHRVPAIANWPGPIQPGTESDATTMTMDLMPTCLQLAGIEMPNDVTFDGTDISRVLVEQAKLPERTLFWRFNNAYTDRHAHAVRQGRWKYVAVEHERFLFDLAADRQEQHNLLERHPDRAAELERAYNAWNDSVAAPASPARKQ